MKTPALKSSLLIRLTSLSVVALAVACSEPAPAKKISAGLSSNTNSGAMDTNTATNTSTNTSTGSGSGSDSSVTTDSTPSTDTNSNSNTGSDTGSSNQSGTGGNNNSTGNNTTTIGTNTTSKELLLGSIDSFKINFDARFKNAADLAKLNQLLQSNGKSTFFIRKLKATGKAEIVSQADVEKGAGKESVTMANGKIRDSITCALRYTDVTKAKDQKLDATKPMYMLAETRPNGDTHFQGKLDLSKYSSAAPQQQPIILGCWYAPDKTKEAVDLRLEALKTLNSDMKGVFQIEDTSAGAATTSVKKMESSYDEEFGVGDNETSEE